MLVTEAEAKTKWCPKAFPAYADGVAGNRWDNDTFCQAEQRKGQVAPRPLNSCLGSQCMFWRWVGGKPATASARIIYPDRADMQGESLNSMRHSEPARPRHATSDYVWVPLTGTGEALDGQYWKETPEAVALRQAEWEEGYFGYCGLAGRPA